MVSLLPRDEMISKSRILLVLLASVLFLSGCQATYTVRNASAKDIIPAFKDYVGMQGYVLKYQNDTTGSYNVDMGLVFVSGVSSATKSKSIIEQPADSNTGQPMTRYEQTSWNEVNNPSRYSNAAAAVRITQNGDDVTIYVDTNDAGGTSFNDIKAYIQSLGYKVD
ncbi:MAG: hypothetical protein ABH860_00360 [bacterium]